jgi:hypothetical protein
VFTGPFALEQVDRDRQVAAHTAADQRQRVEALRQVEAEIGEAQDAVIDAHPEHYLAAAVASSEATMKAITAALEAAQAAAQAWMDTRAAWAPYACRAAGAGWNSGRKCQ